MGTVLANCTSLKRQNGEADEEEIVVKAISDANRPKLDPQDVAVFVALLCHLFPTTKLPDGPTIAKEPVVMAADAYLQRHNFYSSPQLLEKISQV